MAPTPVAPKHGPKTLSTAANLTNLLPTGTVLAFQALVPSFSNNGTCLPAHKYITFCAIVVCSIVCFISSFTDSFVGSDGKLYYGIATTDGLYVFNKENDDDDDDDDNDKDKDKDKEKRDIKDKDIEKGEDIDKDMDKGEGDCKELLAKNLAKYKLKPIDFVHAFTSSLVFLVFATGSSYVQNCFIPHAGANANALMINLPIAVGALASLLFMVFPTKRRGIGYAEMAPRPRPQKLGSSSSART